MSLRRLGILCAMVAALPRAGAAQQQTQASATDCTVTSLMDTAVIRDSTRAGPIDSSAARGERASIGNDRPAIVLYASAAAREVRFAAQPRISVRLCGAVADSVHVIERRNLPERVQPGVTYRDVYIAVEIIGHLNAECLARRIGSAQPAEAIDCASLTARDASGRAPIRRPPP